MDNISASANPEKLLEEIDHLRQSLQSLQEKANLLEHEKAYLEEQIRLMRAILYGKKSEKRASDPSLQPPLFEEAEETKPDRPPSEENKTSVAAHTRAKPGRRPLPDHFPRIEVIHDLPDDEKVCACGCPLIRIGEEVTERLDIVPAKIQVERHIRIKYACRGCEGTDSEGGAVKIAHLPAQIIPQGIVTPGLLAHVVVAKYADAIPLYRQEQQFQRLGLEIGRGTLCNWVLLVAAACLDLIDLMRKEIRAGPVINMDETPVQVLGEPGRSNTSKSFMWVCRGGPPGKPAVIFQYEPTRSGKVPRDILDGYSGYLQTDGYAGYDLVGARPGIVHLGCWAHVRRKFVEVVKGTKGSQKTGVAQAVIDLIGKLYEVEHRGKELEPDRLAELRKAESKPVLDEFKKLLDEKKTTTPPRSLLGIAIAYAWHQWPRLAVYLENGRLSPDNNLAENAVRPFAVGRKNWLFSGSPRGATSSAALYSLLETAKANGLEPYAYFRFLFTELPKASSPDEKRALLPQYVDPIRLPKN